MLLLTDEKRTTTTDDDESVLAKELGLGSQRSGSQSTRTLDIVGRLSSFQGVGCGWLVGCRVGTGLAQRGERVTTVVWVRLLSSGRLLDGCGCECVWWMRIS